MGALHEIVVLRGTPWHYIRLADMVQAHTLLRKKELRVIETFADAFAKNP